MASKLFTMRMTDEERAELDLLTREGGFASAAECLKWLVSVHIDRECIVPPCLEGRERKERAA